MDKPVKTRQDLLKLQRLVQGYPHQFNPPGRQNAQNIKSDNKKKDLKQQHKDKKQSSMSSQSLKLQPMVPATQDQLVIIDFIKSRSKSSCFFVIKMFIEKYPDLIKKEVANNFVFSINGRGDVLRAIQYFFSYFLANVSKPNTEIAIKKPTDSKNNGPRGGNTKHFTTDKQFELFISAIITSLNSELVQLYNTTNWQRISQSSSMLLMNCNQVINLFYSETVQNSATKFVMGQKNEQQFTSYPREIKNIVIYIYQFWRTVITNWTTHTKKLNQNFQTTLSIHKKQFNLEKQQYQRKKQLELTAERNTIKTIKPQLQKSKQRENKLQQIIKNLQGKLTQANLRYNKLTESLQSQKTKRSQAQQLLKSSSKRITTFATILNHNIQEQLTNVTTILSQQSLNYLKQQGEFSCDYSILVKKEQSLDLISEFSILKGLNSLNQNLIMQQNQNQSNHLSDYQSELGKIKQNIQKMFERIKNQIRLQNQQKEKKLKKYIQQNKQGKSFSKLNNMNSDSKSGKDSQSQIQMSHLKIQFSIAKAEKQAIMKKLAEKQYEISQANERIEELQKQLQQNNKKIKILQQTKQKQQNNQSIKYQKNLQKIIAEQQKNNNIQLQKALEIKTQKMNDMRNTIVILQQQIQELRIKNSRFQLDKETNQQYLKQKTQQYFQLKLELKKKIESENLLNQIFKEREAKIDAISTQKEILILTNNKLHRQIEMLRGKRNILTRPNINFQEQIQIFKNKQQNQMNQSLILQKVTIADQSIEEI